MTAVALFDILSHEGVSVDADEHSGHPMVRLATQLVESALADYQRVRQYQDDFTPSNWENPASALAVERSIYSLHEQWIAEAEQVFSRAKQLTAAGHMVPNVDQLRDAIGFTKARLKMTPEKIAHAMEQIRRGEFIPVSELRDELRTRLRA